MKIRFFPTEPEKNEIQFQSELAEMKYKYEIISEII